MRITKLRTPEVVSFSYLVLESLFGDTTRQGLPIKISASQHENDLGMLSMARRIPNPRTLFIVHSARQEPLTAMVRSTNRFLVLQKLNVSLRVSPRLNDSSRLRSLARWS